MDVVRCVRFMVYSEVSGGARVGLRRYSDVIATPYGGIGAPAWGERRASVGRACETSARTMTYAQTALPINNMKHCV